MGEKIGFGVLESFVRRAFLFFVMGLDFSYWGNHALSQNIGKHRRLNTRF